METAMKLIFWFCLLLLFYIYIGYPVLIRFLARFFGKPVKEARYAGKYSVVIAAHNEGGRIGKRIQNVLDASLADQMTELLVGSDGSTDNTADVVRACEDPRVRLLKFPERRGKAAVLNDLISQCREPIVVLSDARQEWADDAVEQLLRAFEDELVGVVSGELVFRDKGSQAGVAQGVGQYWNYEKSIRRSEGAFRSVPGATGALYAIRKSLFRNIPAETLLDDVLIPMQAVTQGYRCVFERGARVYDDVASEIRKESQRKRRTIAGNIQLMGLHPEWLLPWRHPIWFEFVSHKILRLFSPLLLIGLFLSSLKLCGSALYLAVCSLQVLFYACAFLGFLLRRKSLKAGILTVPLAFTSLNYTTLLAWYDAARGTYDPKWVRSLPE